jgi:DNA helicase-2/ATP-dependent DNA helicase PcrA
VVDLASEIEWAKARCLAPDDFVRAAAFAGRRGSWAPEEVAWIWEAYELEKRRRQVLDFEDLLLRTTEQLLCDHRFAASARWRFRHVFVDEYQDVNESQQRLLRAWLGANDDICVVGDPNQAIYAWNGAKARAISDFPDDFAGSKVLTLSINYRSTHEVLSVAGAVLGERRALPAGGPRPEGPVPTVRGYSDELAEAAGVAEAVRRAKRPGRSWSQIAILARTNAQLRVIEEALLARGVPCQTSGSSPLLRKSWVEDALTAVARAATREALAAWRGDLLAATTLAREDEASGQDRSSPSEAQLDLEALALLAGDYLTEDFAATGAGFRSWMEASQASEAGLRRRDAVALTTFHRAKGLEWPVVFLTGLELGYVPIAHAKDADALAEERRLLYVACTRAAEELHCSWAAQRSFSSGQAIPRSPSPWLEAIEAAHHDLERLRRTDPDTARRALAESRRALE